MGELSMKIRPNDKKELNSGSGKNDLYIKFRIPFDRILNKDFDEFGAYNDKVYISVDKELEDEIVMFFDEKVDGICPLIGAKGIGKTHMIMNVLKKYYNDTNIKSNKVFIEEVGNDEYDIVLCCAHEKYNKSILSELTKLLYYRVQTISHNIHKQFNIPDIEYSDLEHYIDELKGEVLFYLGEPKDYAVQTMHLKYLLSESGINFRNFVLIYDDLESLNGEAQHTLIGDLLALYECLRNKKSNSHKTLLKYMFCLRTTTYSNLSSRSDYDTHRVKRPLLLRKYPSLSELFERRFDLCVRNFNLLQEAGNKDSWVKAKEILMDLSQRLDNCSKDLLVKLNNYNISDALEDFARILSNRKWTQKNKNVSESFKIREEEYYINNVNIFRVLFMGESDVYINNTMFCYPTIFIEGQNRRQDFWCLYLLLFFSKRYNKYLRTSSYNHLSVNEEEAIDVICSVFSEVSNESIIKKSLKRLIVKMTESRFLENDNFPREKEEAPEKAFYITALGNTIFEEFFKSNILFSIFRDELSVEQGIYNVKCTCDITQEELNEEFFKYINEFWGIEKEFFSLVNADPLRKEEYMENFGDFVLSQKMLKALKESLFTYYKDDINNNQVVVSLIRRISGLNTEIDKFIKF